MQTYEDNERLTACYISIREASFKYVGEIDIGLRWP